MKSAIKGFLSALGLAPAAQTERLTKEARDLAARVAQLEERLTQARADADSWKRRHTETADALAGWKQAAAKGDAETERVRAGSERLAADVERAAADVKREQARTEEWRTRAEKLAADAQDLRVRLQNSRAKLDDAERAAATAHEHLMAMEVKLDLLEAAAQVLESPHARPGRAARVQVEGRGRLRPMHPPPFLSIVVTGRHDNYGGDFNERFFTALRFNHERLAERDVPFEIILVEWNPIPDRPTLCELAAHEFPTLAGVLRRIVVPPEYHIALTQNPRIPYLEYAAKNAGIRRAAAPFILVSNTDILLGRHVVDVIAGRRLRPGVVYRAPRYDIKLGADQSSIGWDALENPSNHIRRPSLSPPLFAGGSGDFALADRETFHSLRGYNEVYRAGRHGVDHNFLVKAHGAGVRIEDIGGPVYHINHVGSYRISKALYRRQPEGRTVGRQPMALAPRRVQQPGWLGTGRRTGAHPA